MNITRKENREVAGVAALGVLVLWHTAVRGEMGRLIW